MYRKDWQLSSIMYDFFPLRQVFSFFFSLWKREILLPLNRIWLIRYDGRGQRITL